MIQFVCDTPEHQQSERRSRSGLAHGVIKLVLAAGLLGYSVILRGGTPPDPLPLRPVQFRILYRHKQLWTAPAAGRLAVEGFSGASKGPISGPSGVDQVSVASYDPVNNALRVNALLTSGGVHTPTDANQVFTSIYDPVHNAIQINCVVGCGGGGGGSFIAAGDLSGSGTSQTVIGLQTRPVASTAPTANQVLAWSGSAWTPATLASGGAGAGACAANQFVTGVNLGSAPTCVQPSFANVTGTISPSQFPAATGTSQGAVVLAGDLAGSASAPLVAGLQGRPLGPASPSSGQVLSWNGSAWTPTTPSSGGAQIAGDLGGTLALPTVVGLQTRPVASTAPTANQVLAWSGSAWTPTTLASGGAGAGACAANQFVTGVNLGSAPTCVQPSFANLSGTIFPVQLPAATGTSLGAMMLTKDLAGSATAPLVAGLQGNPVGPASPSNGQALVWNGSAWTPTTLATGGAVMQVNGTNAASQATINFQSGTNITVSNPSAGNVAFNLSGTVPVANGGTGLTTVGASGQCLTSNGTALAWGSCGSGGGGGVSLTPSASQTIQPTAGSNTTPLAIAPATGTTQTADLFDVWKDSAMTTKAMWVDASGNLNFLGNNATYGAVGQNTQSFLRLYGSTVNSNLAPPYLDLEKVDGSVKTYLAPSTSTNGLLCASSSVPGGDCGPTIASTNFLVSAAGGTAPTTNDCVKWISSTQIGDSGSACGSGGGGATIQVNGTNTTSASPINFQSGANITVSNPSAGNVAFNLTGTIPVANGGTGLTTVGTSGQCLTSNGTALAWGSCGSGGGGGVSLTPSASQTIQPTAGSNTTPLAIAPATGATQTADLFDVWKDSAMTTKAMWVDASGNLNFLGNNATYGAVGQNTQSFLRLYGSTTSSNLAPPYLDLEKVDGSVKAYLAPSTSVAGLVCVSSTVPGSDCTAGTTLAANPMTAAGDLIVGGTPNTLGVASPTRLALGTSGQCLTSTGTTAAWGPCGGGGSGVGTIFTSTLNGAQVSAGSSQYIGPNSSFGLANAEYNTESIVPVACTAQNLYIFISAAQGNGTLTVTLRTGTAGGTMNNTTLSKAILATSAAGVYSDTTDTVALAAGSAFDIQLNNASTALSANISSVTFQCK